MEDLVEKYEEILRELSKQSGIIGTIFTKASNKIDRPAHLAKVIQMVKGEDPRHPLNWYMMEGDLKAHYMSLFLKKMV